MKVRVMYTETLYDEDLRALAAYGGKSKMTRDEVRALLTQVGTMGVEEQIAEGYDFLAGSASRDGPV